MCGNILLKLGRPTPVPKPLHFYLNPQAPGIAPEPAASRFTLLLPSFLLMGGGSILQLLGTRGLRGTGWPAKPRKRQEKLNQLRAKALDKINDQIIRLQPRFTPRALLTHINSYTRTSYAKEPGGGHRRDSNQREFVAPSSICSSLPEYLPAADVLWKMETCG